MRRWGFATARYLSYLRWRAAGPRVPETILLNRPEDLRIQKRGPSTSKACTRYVTGGAGRGALSTGRLEQAREWIVNRTVLVTGASGFMGRCLLAFSAGCRNDVGAVTRHPRSVAEHRGVKAV